MTLREDAFNTQVFLGCCLPQKIVVQQSTYTMFVHRKTPFLDLLRMHHHRLSANVCNTVIVYCNGMLLANSIRIVI